MVGGDGRQGRRSNVLTFHETDSLRYWNGSVDGIG